MCFSCSWCCIFASAGRSRHLLVRAAAFCSNIVITAAAAVHIDHWRTGILLVLAWSIHTLYSCWMTVISFMAASTGEISCLPMSSSVAVQNGIFKAVTSVTKEIARKLFLSVLSKCQAGYG